MKKPNLTGLLVGIIAGVAVSFLIVFFGLNVPLSRPETPGTSDPTISSEEPTSALEVPVVSDFLKEKLSVIRDQIDQVYLFDKGDPDFDSAIIKGYVDAIGDPYTVYYTPEEYEDLMESTNGHYSGIGVMVQQATDKTITAVRVFRDSPAEKAGMQKGDIITGVDGEDIQGQDLSLVVSKMKGPEGTDVKVRVYRPTANDYFDLLITRADIETESVTYTMLDNHIGYIEVISFDEPTAAQFKNAFQSLTDAGMQGLVVDLRDNGGGLLSTVVDMLDMLVPKGTITYTVDKNGNRRDFTSESDSLLTVPCSVLVNGNTASASEIFTGAMKDYGLATVVGETTFGKGIVQQVFQLWDGSGLKVTTARYYTPNGTCIHGIGITPDVGVPDDPNTEADEVLDAGIRALKK